MTKQSNPETSTEKRPDETNKKTGQTDTIPPEGPHAREHLIDPDKTPGTGALTERRQDGDADAATG